MSRQQRVDPIWEKDMRRARALVGVMLFEFSNQRSLDCFSELQDLKLKWREKYDPSGFGFHRSDSPSQIAKVILGCGPVSTVVNTSIGQSGKKSPKRKSRKASRSTT
jgi:hypothetical protein